MPKPDEGAAELKTNGEGLEDGAGAAREMKTLDTSDKMITNQTMEVN